MRFMTRLAGLAFIGFATFWVSAAATSQAFESGSDLTVSTDCVPGTGLGASLLFPYFEVDLADPEGINTLISVNNGLDEPGLVRLIVWTDWGVPTAAFDIYLEANDIQTISLRSLFNGNVPSTGDPSSVDGYPFCTIFPPYHDNPALDSDRIGHLRAVHTGRPSPVDGLCSGADHGDELARGYITVDSVNLCGGLESLNPTTTPANPTLIYFNNDQIGSTANNLNLLWGDIVYIDDGDNAAHGTGAVALWSDSLRFGGVGRFTFYGRFSDWDTRDDRVPLPGDWVQRFLNGGPFAGGAELIVFRHPNHAAAEPIACGSPPSWYPLRSTITTMDEDAGGSATHQTDLLGLVTQRVSVAELLPSPADDFGLVRISEVDDQMWVQTVLTGLGRFSVALDGTVMGTTCGAMPPSATTAAVERDDHRRSGSQ
jgi:hypothetical protein